MTKAILRWAIPLSGLLLVGPLAGMCTIGLRARDGSDAVTPFLADSPFMGVILGVAAMLIAGAFGVVATWINGLKSGLFTTGLILAWATWGLGNMDDIMRRTQSSGTMWKLSGEGTLFGLLAVVLAVALALVHTKRLSRAASLSGSGSPARPHSSTAQVAEDVRLRTAILSALAATVPVMGVVVWIVATEPLKGQAFAAAAIGAMLGTVAGKWAGRAAPAVVFVAAAAILAAASPVAATFYHGTEVALVRSSLAGSLFPLARLIPLDWIAGTFVGVPMGMNLASGFFDHHHDDRTH